MGTEVHSGYGPISQENSLRAAGVKLLMGGFDKMRTKQIGNPRLTGVFSVTPPTAGALNDPYYLRNYSIFTYVL